MLTRRALLAGVIAGIGWPLSGEAQHSAQAPAHIVILTNSSIEAQRPQPDAFRLGLRDYGWIDGQNIRIEYRSAEGSADHVRTLVAEIVRLKLDAIVASGTIALRALQQATKTIPVVSSILLVDPVRLGFAASLARLGGNITGLTSQYEQIITKHVELLAATVPGISRVMLLYHATADTELAAAAATGAETLGLKARLFVVSEMGDVERAFKAARNDGAQALLAGPSPIFNDTAASSSGSPPCIGCRLSTSSRITSWMEV
jgi:putative tryptophan/tyrosine transport system substrate-binding protein